MIATWRPLVVALLGSAACLSSPPGGIDTPSDDADPADAASGPDGADAAVICDGLELLVESFEETDPEARFLELWDPGTAEYVVGGGGLTLTANDGEAQINSLDFYDRIGTLRFEAVTTAGDGGFVALSLNGAPNAARILINDTTIDLYAPDNQHVEIARDLSLGHFSLGFDGGEVVLAGSADGVEWTSLQRWPDRFDEGPVRVAIAVHRIGGTLSLLVDGINVATGPDCPAK